MKQKILLLCLALLTGITATAATITQNYDYAVANDDGVTIYYKKYNNTVSVTYKEYSYNGYNTYPYSYYSGDIKIPSEITVSNTTYSVTGIVTNAFINCTSLTSVSIPESVTSIGYNAFKGCSGLTSVYISDIEAWCKISFGGEYSNPLYYAHNLYCNDELVTNIEIPSTITAIKSFAFDGASCLTTVSVPETVTSIGNFAFRNCSDLTSINIPEAVTSIGNYAFQNCSKLTSISIPGAVTSIGNYAFDGCSGVQTLIFEDGEETITIGAGTSDHYAFQSVKPQTIYLGRNLSYTSPYSPLKDNTNLTSVTIGDKVTTIGESAFSNCSGLTSVNTTDIESWCKINFSGTVSNPLYYAHNLYCNNELVTNLEVPSTITAINNYAFQGATCLTSVSLPETITSIGTYAFNGCSGLTSISIPEAVTSIGSSAFSGCSSLASISIPEAVTSIGDNTFSGCSSLTSINIPEAMTSIGSSAFSSCSGLTSISIPAAVTSIGNYAFSGCSGLTSISIPEAVTSIGEYTFNGCSSLTSINIPKAVTSIGTYAFRNCSKLTSISIPGAVTSIGNYAFDGCSGVQSLTFEDGEETITIGTGTSDHYAFQSVKPQTIYLGRNLTYYNSYSPLKDNTNLTSLTIGNKVTSIGTYAFSGCSGVQTLIFEDGEESLAIGTGTNNHYAFQSVKPQTIYLGRNLTYYNSYSPLKDNTNLTSLTIGEKVTSFGNSAFSGCSSLTSINIPEAMTSIGSSAFSRCSGLTSISIPKAVTSIGDYAFNGCSALTTVNIPNNSVLATIGSYSFQNCSSLSSINIPASVTSIDTYTFNGCTALTTVDIPNNSVLATIGSYSFQNCSSLSSINIPAGVTSIDSYAFSGCTSMTSAIISDNSALATIGDYAFNGCSSLRYFNFPESLTTIGAYAFYGCTNFPSALIIPNSVTSIGTYAFAECSKIKNVKIGSGVTTIGDLAFYRCTALELFQIDGDVTSIGTATFANSYPTILFMSQEPHAYGYNSRPCVVPGVAVAAYKAAWPGHESEILTSAIPFKYEVTTTASAIQSDIVEKVNAIALSYSQDLTDALLNVTELKVTGSINSYDIMALHNKMVNLQRLDLSEANIVANSYEYYTGYCSKDNVVTTRFLGEMAKLTSVKLPNSAITIEGDVTKSVRTLILKKVEIGNGTTSIADNAFKGNTTIEEIILGESVETIGTYAFLNCKALKSITLVPSIKSIAYSTSSSSTIGAFEGCTALTSVEIQCQNLVNLYGTFKNCTALKTVNIADDAPITIGTKAFYGCTALESIHTGKSTRSIGEEAFSGCTGLQNVVIGDLTFAIGNKAFYGCTGLKSVTFGDNVYTIGSYAFNGCTGLKSVTFGENVNTIGNYAFQNCSSLESVIIPKGVKTISYCAFDACSGLKNVTFSPGLVTISQYAFQNCTSLEAAMLPTSLETIGTYAFSGCTNLKELKIPSSIKTIGDYAFNAPNIADIYTWTIEPTNINQNTFASALDTQALIHVPATAHRLYFYDTQWSKFIRQADFSEPYEYFYLTNKDLIVDEETERLDGNPEAELGIGSGLKIAGNEPQNLSSVRLLSNGTHSAAIIGEGNPDEGNTNLNIDDLTIEIEITKNKWYFFSFPFTFEFGDITFPGQYVWRWYDGQVRAEQGSGQGAWKDETEKVYANKGYIFQGSATGILKLHAGKVSIGNENLETPLQMYASTNANDASWNLVGNPFTCYYEVNDMDYDAPVTTWNGTTYEAVRPGDDPDSYIAPYEAFFVQTPETHSQITYFVEAQQTKNQIDDPLYETETPQALAARRAKRAKDRFLINVELSADSVIDRTRVVFNEKKTMDYELDCDASKFYSDIVAQIYTIGYDNVTNYAINERPLGDGIVKLGFMAPCGGTFTISASREDIPMEIYDVKTRKSALLCEGYTFNASKGTDNDRFILRLPAGSSALDKINNDMEDSDAEYYGIDGISRDKQSSHGVLIEKRGSSSRKVYNR